MSRAGASRPMSEIRVTASDLVWVLPALTCGYSSERALFRVVREF